MINVELLKEKTKTVMFKNGWHEGRDVSSVLTFNSEKELFSKFMDIANSFMGLKMSFLNRYDKNVKLYFDFDESVLSLDLTAEIWGYYNHLDPRIKDDSDYRNYYNGYEVSLATSIMDYLSKKCVRFGFLDDEDAYDLYISEDGYIYAVHDDLPTLIARSFEDFLNNELTGNRQVLELPNRT